MAVTTRDPLDVAAIKGEFPILAETVHGKRLVYLDSASIDATEHVGPRSLPMLEP